MQALYPPLLEVASTATSEQSCPQLTMLSYQEANHGWNQYTLDPTPTLHLILMTPNELSTSESTTPPAMPLNSRPTP